MNLSSSNNVAANSHPITPVSQGPPSDDPPSAAFEQYRSPLVDLYYTPNCTTTLRCSSAMEEQEEPPEVPPLPSAQSLEQSPVAPVGTSPPYYRSLQNTPNLSPKSNMINLGNYFPKIASDPPNRKLYHTAPREKQRVKSYRMVYSFAFSRLRINFTDASACRVLEHSTEHGTSV